MLTDRCKRYVLTTALTCVFLIPQAASALGFSAFNGNEMLKHCKAWVSLLDNPNFQDLDNPDTLRAMARGDLVNGAHCVGYVSGVIDDHFSWQILGDHFKSGQRLSLQNRPTEVAVQD